MQAEDSHRRELYAVLGVAIIFARQLSAEPETAEWFFADPIWGGKRPNVAKNPLLAVLKWAYRGPNKSARYERARTHACAIRQAFNDNVPAEEIAGFIDSHGGLTFLARGGKKLVPAIESSDDDADWPAPQTTPLRVGVVADAVSDDTDEDDLFSESDSTPPDGEAGARRTLESNGSSKPPRQAKLPKYASGTDGYNKFEILVLDCYPSPLALAEGEDQILPHHTKTER